MFNRKIASPGESHWATVWEETVRSAGIFPED